MWYATTDNGLAALVYSPCKVTATVGNGTRVTINEETAYPFDNKIDFTISLAQNTPFPLELRIPEWCNEATILLNGIRLNTVKGNQVTRLMREWKNNDKVTLELPMQVITSNWGKNSRTVERGPLVYALKIGERWEKKNIKEEGDFYEVYPTTSWNYGIVSNVIENPAKNSKVIEKPLKKEFVWNSANAPIEIQINARKIPGWILVNGVAHQPVTPRDGIYLGEVSEKQDTITLIPYGCSKLRIVAFPVVK